MATARSKATRKYEAKIGIGSKTYRVNLELAKQFKEACERTGVSQTQALAEFMKSFVEEANSQTDGNEHSDS